MENLFYLLIFIGFAYFLYTLNKNKKDELLTNEIETEKKIKILSHSHSDFKKLFNEFENNQFAWDKKNRNDEFYEEGEYYNIFNRNIFVYYKHMIPEFKMSVMNLYNKLQTNTDEKRRIDEIISSHNEIVKTNKRLATIELLKWQQNRHEYGKILKEIFTNTKSNSENKNVRISLEDLSETLKIKLGNRISDPKEFIQQNSKGDCKILFKEPNSNLFWYDEYILDLNMKDYIKYHSL